MSNTISFPSDFFSDIQMSNITRPQSPVAMEGHIPKISSSPPKATSGWLSLNPAHKKGTALLLPAAQLTVMIRAESRWELKKGNMSGTGWQEYPWQTDCKSVFSHFYFSQRSPRSPRWRTSDRGNTAASFQTSSMGPLSVQFSASPVIGSVGLFSNYLFSNTVV